MTKYYYSIALPKSIPTDDKKVLSMLIQHANDNTKGSLLAMDMIKYYIDKNKIPITIAMRKEND